MYKRSERARSPGPEGPGLRSFPGQRLQRNLGQVSILRKWVSVSTIGYITRDILKDQGEGVAENSDGYVQGHGEAPAPTQSPHEAAQVNDQETPGGQVVERDQVANDREQTSEADDKAAEARDDRAEERDDRAEERDRAIGRFDAEAGSDRAEALRDRGIAAIDRAHAAADRGAASLNRAVSARERIVSSIDGLTGALRRDSGSVQLNRDAARARRTGQPFLIGYVDVDGLKKTNDAIGHAGGDQLLRQIVDTIRIHLRSYDLVVRFGGDEFVCGLLDMSIDEANQRFSQINAELAESLQSSITVGLAELKPSESLEDLITRADEAMYKERLLR